MAKVLDIEKLRASVTGLDRFRTFEREIEQSIDRENDERRRKYEEVRRASEKRARKKRLKAQSSAA